MKRLYNLLMARNILKSRPKQGEHLFKLREEAGLSQREIAALIGEPQQNIAFWEQAEKPPRSDALPKLAKALGVKLEDILNIETEIPKKNGPTGRLQVIFEEVSKLPRRQQHKIIEVVAAIVAQYRQVKTA